MRLRFAADVTAVWRAKEFNQINLWDSPTGNAFDTGSFSLLF
jgi:hypothetical protein